MKRTKLFLPVIANLASCSKNYYPVKLLDYLKFQNQEMSVWSTDSKMDMFEYEGKFYELPVRTKIKEAKSKQ